MKYQTTSTVVPLLAGVLFALLSSVVAAQDTDRRLDGARVETDAADSPARDPGIERPQTTEEKDINLRQGPSGPDIAPGVERDARVPIPHDNDGMIDPH